MKYSFRRIKWWFHRANHGWAPNDAWDLNSYLEGVIKESVTHLAYNRCGYPGTNRFNTSEKWEHFLKSVAKAIDDYHKEEDNLDYTDIKEQIAREEKAYKHMQKKLHQLVNVWPHLWD